MYVRQSVTATELLEGGLKIQNCNATRWNSQQVMVRSILANDEDSLSKIVLYMYMYLNIKSS